MDVRSADRYVLQLLQQGMNGFGGRLFQKVRQERGLAYTTYAGADFTTLAGVLYFYAGTPPATADQVADLLRAELLRLRDEPFTKDELERARGGSIGSYEIGLETAGYYAGFLASSAINGRPLEVQPRIDGLRAVTVDDVQRVARTYFDPARITQVIVRPEEAP
jgi:predicted Zn-dependent peptidase